MRCGGAVSLAPVAILMIQFQFEKQPLQSAPRTPLPLVSARAHRHPSLLVKGGHFCIFLHVTLSKTERLLSDMEEQWNMSEAIRNSVTFTNTLILIHTTVINNMTWHCVVYSKKAHTSKNVHAAHSPVTLTDVQTEETLFFYPQSSPLAVTSHRGTFCCNAILIWQCSVRFCACVLVTGVTVQHVFTGCVRATTVYICVLVCVRVCVCVYVFMTGAMSRVHEAKGKRC